jgi:UDP-N-acetylmuramoyl-tripeptide--D-alanyl-D-alanine ligase
MKEFSVAALAKIIGAPMGQGARRQSSVTTQTSYFTGVSIDSRTAKAGDCFFAIRGEKFDGHDYVADAFAKGAVCAVANEKSKIKNQKSKFRCPVLRVADTVRALGKFARWYRQQAGFKVIAITGSVGKTTTRQIVYHALSRHFRVCVAPKNFNNNVGLPLTLLAADAEDEIVIAELGSNHPGEIAYLTRIALPDIAVVANVRPAHLEGLGNLQAVAKEKLSISEGLSNGGVLIINAEVVRWLDDSQLNYQLPITSHQVTTFGTSPDSDYRASDIAFDGFSSSFTIHGPRHTGSRARIHLPLPGRGNVENALAACAICSQFGLAIDDFADAARDVRPVAMRLEPLQIGTLTVLNDCYNANPASMKNALDILRNLEAGEKRRLVFICGDMAELGRQAPALHAELGEYAASAGVQVLLAVGEYAKLTAEAAKRAADYELRAECFEDTASVCDNLQKFIKDSDIILVKGSRIAKLEIVTEKLKELFS